MTNEPRTATYLRMSTDRGDRIEDHRASTDQLRLRKGLPIGPEYVDNDVSAGKDRAASTNYARLFADATAGKVNVIITHDLDRFLRRLKDLETWLELAETRSLRLLSVSDDVDTATAAGRMYLRIRITMAQFENEQKSARQKFANVQRVRAGGRLAGNRSFGFTKDGEQKPAEAELIKWLAAHLLAKGSVRQAVAKLNEAGYPTAKGNPWTGISLKRMIVNPRNAGLAFYHGQYVAQSAGGVIISEDVWRAVCDLLKDPTRKSHDGISPTSLVSGFGLCGVCGGPLTSCSTRHKTPQPGYKCKAGCVFQRQAPVDEIVITQVLGQVFFTDMYLQEQQTTAPKDETELVALRLRRQSLATDYADDVITRDVMLAGIARCDAKIAELEAVVPEPVLDGSWQGLVSGINDRAWWDSLTLSQQRSICRPFTIKVNRSERAGANSKARVGVLLELPNANAHILSLQQLG